MKHRLVQALGLGIVAAAMVTVIQHYAVRQCMPHAMRKFIVFCFQVQRTQHRKMSNRP